MSRAQAQIGELYGIQMLRGIAALSVVVHHTLEESNGAAGRFSPEWLTTVGAMGVDIFFVISGFIMLYVGFGTDRPPERPRAFLQRRMTRIYPFYWVCCAAMLLLVAGGFLKGQRLDASDLVTSLLLLPGHHLLIGVAWTLVFEIGFYLVFAALLPLASAVRVAGGTTIVFILLLLLAPVLPPGPARSLAANPVTLEFCLGLWLAWSFVTARARGGWLGDVRIGICAAALAAGATLLVPHSGTAGLAGWPRLIGWGLPALLIVAAGLDRSVPRGVVGRALARLGDASYALYLTHVFVMIGYAWLIKHRDLGSIDQRPVALAVVAVAVAAGLVAHRLIERPLLGRLSRSRPGATAGRAAARPAATAR